MFKGFIILSRGAFPSYGVPASHKRAEDDRSHRSGQGVSLDDQRVRAVGPHHRRKAWTTPYVFLRALSQESQFIQEVQRWLHLWGEYLDVFQRYDMRGEVLTCGPPRLSLKNIRHRVLQYSRQNDRYSRIGYFSTQWLYYYALTFEFM